MSCVEVSMMICDGLISLMRVGLDVSGSMLYII